MKKLLINLMLVFSLTGVGTILLLPGLATASAKEDVCEGVGIATGGSGCTNPAGGPTVESGVKAAINILSLIVGIVSVIMIIIGGLKYIISSGDSGNIKSAKDTILYALIGLVIVALSQVIVRFVLEKTTNTGAPKCTTGQVSTAANPCTP